MLVFSDTPILYPPTTLVVQIPPANDKAQLLDALHRELHFPAYFGHNWDALNDCLTDLGWIQQDHIVLWHINCPRLAADELQLYIDLLIYAAQQQAEQGKLLIALFPEAARLEIQQ